MSTILHQTAARGTMSADPEIRLLAIFYNALDGGRKQQLLDYSHHLIEGQRDQQRADDDGMSMPA
jgi:hypothetical protein